MTSKLRGLIRLFRMELPFAAGVCVLLGELLALGRLPALREAALGFASVFFISAGALIINDVFDLEADKVNAPERPLPSGAVMKAEATALFVAVTLLGLAASVWLSGTAFIAALIVWAVGFLYNARAKRWGLAGNVMVALSVSMTFIFGGIAVGRPFEPLVWLLAVTALLIDLGEEIAGDAMDAEGARPTDRAAAGVHPLDIPLCVVGNGGVVGG